jgi:formamidopyrimidine-DNA glycosylase
MPELPEAETIARQLRSEIIGAQIDRVQVRHPRSIRRRGAENENPNPGFASRRARFARALRGRRITGVGRRGKAVLLTLDDADTLVVRLGMSGQILVRPTGTPREKAARVILGLGERELRFVDPRTFGQMAVRRGTGPDAFPDFWEYGPEPLSPKFTPAYLAAALRGRRTRIGVALMDQHLVAGIGKIYADEICFRAGLRPTRLAGRLTRPMLQRLWRAARQVLREAIRCCGTTDADGAYLDAFGQAGRFRTRLRVYRRTGQPCRVCGTPIRRTRLSGGRGMHWCPVCQR